MFDRRRFLTHSASAALGLTAVGRLAGDNPDNVPDGRNAKDMITPQGQQAIDRGLDYLARSQQLDGSFGTGQHKGNVAITSLAGLAFMAGGSQPGRGPHGKAVLNALDFVLNQANGRFYLHNKSGTPHGPMYGHGFGTLFLAEAYGMMPSRELRDRLRATLKGAVDLIINSQNGKGGWRYNPDSRDADISVTVCQIMALRAARNAGFAVPRETVDQCTKYVKSCQHFDGGFRYMNQGGDSGFARTAAGVSALYCAGIYKGPEVENGLKYLVRWHQRDQHFPRHDMHYFYGHYYAAQAMWTAGGSYWSEWYPDIRDELTGHTHRLRPDGSWVDQICPHYGTAMACIILQIPNNYLPIFQK
jgi:hypothetical protein